MAKLLDYDMERSKVFLQTIPFAENLMKYGTGIAKVSWRYEQHLLEGKYRREIPDGFDIYGQLKKILGKVMTKREPVVDFDGPWVDPISPFNFGPDPLYPELDQMRYCWFSRYTDRETLQKDDEDYFKLTGEHLYKGLDKIPKLAKNATEDWYQMDGSDDTAEAMGWNSSSINSNKYAQVRDADSDRDHAVQIIEYWERDRVVEMANGERIIRDTPNPYEDKKLPFLG